MTESAIVFDRDSPLKHIDKGKKRKKSKKQIGLEKSQRKAQRLKRDARARKHMEEKQYAVIEDNVNISYEEIEATPGELYANKDTWLNTNFFIYQLF